MKLSSLALTMIDNPKTRMKIALEIGRSERTVKGWIVNNHDDLTKKSVVAVIMAETGLTEEQIFETVAA